MPSAFDFSASPFDTLDADERQIVRDNIDIAYFRDDEVILETGAEPESLFVIIKGHVSEYEGDELIATFGPTDCFDGRALVTGRAGTRFVAAEEVVAYQLSCDTAKNLISLNASFSALLFSDLSKKLGALASRHDQREMVALTMSRVSEAFLRSAHEINGDTVVVDAARAMQSHHANSVLVRDGEALGIFTNTGLQRAVTSGQSLEQTPVREFSTFKLATISPDAPLFDALAVMIQRQVHRLVVTDETGVVGLLEQLDLMSFLSNHSYLITMQIVEAEDLDALKEAAGRITRLVAMLYRGGTRVGQIGQLVQALNSKLFARTWELVAPAELIAGSCLFVMGSEGRGEQLLKTDQDNGLVIREDLALDDATIAAACERFSAALITFGYPVCPGGIMVNNAAWRKRQSVFTTTVREWLLRPTPEGLMALAIFIDADPVAGDTTLLAALRRSLDGLVSSSDALLGRFAAAIDAFPSQTGGWWNRLLLIGEGGKDAEIIDLKKAGIFPIVHGVRSMALAERLDATNTVARLDALVGTGSLSREFATDLTDSLQFLMEMKLKAGLAEIDLGRPVSGGVPTERLSSLERDLLKDSLALVRKFKATVRHRFHLSDG